MLWTLLYMQLAAIFASRSSRMSNGLSSQFCGSSAKQARYYFVKEATDFDTAGETCRSYGSGYNLAAIKTQGDLDALTDFLNRNVSPQTALWISGSYSQSDGRFVWTRLNGRDGKQLPLDPFVLRLIEGYPSKYTSNDRTIFSMQDYYTPSIHIENYSAARRFVCEYRED